MDVILRRKPKNPMETVFARDSSLKLRMTNGVRQGSAVLDHYPRYIELANEIGSRKFDVPMDVWNNMTDTERWTANQKFLDRSINRGDKIILATPVHDANTITGYFRRELDYLFQRGYRLNADGTELVRR